MGPRPPRERARQRRLSPSTPRRRPTASTSPGRSRTPPFGENSLVLSSRRPLALARPPPERLRGRARPRSLRAGGRRERAGAGLVAGFVTGGVQTELDGRILGYAATPSGGRQLLLARPDGLEWFELPAVPEPRVAVDFDARGASRARPAAPSRSTRRAQVSRGGSSSSSRSTAGPLRRGCSAHARLLYRAVWVDPATGVPYARLFGP